MTVKAKLKFSRKLATRFSYEIWWNSVRILGIQKSGMTTWNCCTRRLQT